MQDIIKEKFNTEIPKVDVLDKGFVELWDVMPRLVPEGQTADFAIAQAARTSYQQGTKKVNQDEGLIRYLIRHRHTTPLEMVEFKFRCKLPIIAARQWIRHRTANVNEMSARYSVLPDEFYIPEINEIRTQSQSNKQKTEEVLEKANAEKFKQVLEKSCEDMYCEYEKALDNGVCREQARMLLPVNCYTVWVWKIDLHNLLHFLALRCDSHAQYEIRVFADAMLSLIKPIVPITVQAWEEYHPLRGGMQLTSAEVQAIRKSICSGLPVPKIDVENGREQDEWVEKAELLGFA